MPLINEAMTVDEILRRWPATAPVLNRYAVDMCCGGALSLRQAAASAGVPLQQLLQELEETTSSSVQ